VTGFDNPSFFPRIIYCLGFIAKTKSETLTGRNLRPVKVLVSLNRFQEVKFMKRIRSSVLPITLLFLLTGNIFADIKIRQKMTMSGQTFETTKMIKGARQRTEQKGGAGGAMDFMSQVATIEQCDLRRNVQLNDGKKLYFIQPFAQESVTETTTPVKRPEVTQTKQGGTITMTY
jgi:hypothetical protein